MRFEHCEANWPRSKSGRSLSAERGLQQGPDNLGASSSLWHGKSGILLRAGLRNRHVINRHVYVHPCIRHLLLCTWLPSQIRNVPANELNRRIKNVLREVDVRERLDSFPDQLSIRTKQRLHVAIAILSSPEVRILLGSSTELKLL